MVTAAVEPEAQPVCCSAMLSSCRMVAPQQPACTASNRHQRLAQSQHLLAIACMHPILQEEEALERAQRAGEAASSLAGERMAEQWVALTGTPEWRTLAARFPDTIRQLSEAAAAGGEGAGGGSGGSRAEWLGSGDSAGDAEAA